MDYEKTAENRGKRKRMYMFLECADNPAISIDRLSVSIICHSQPYFQYRLEQNNLKPETNIEYTKVRKARGTNGKSEA